MAAVLLVLVVPVLVLVTVLVSVLVVVPVVLMLVADMPHEDYKVDQDIRPRLSESGRIPV